MHGRSHVPSLAVDERTGGVVAGAERGPSGSDLSRHDIAFGHCAYLVVKARRQMTRDRSQEPSVKRDERQSRPRIPRSACASQPSDPVHFAVWPLGKTAGIRVLGIFVKSCGLVFAIERQGKIGIVKAMRQYTA